MTLNTQLKTGDVVQCGRSKGWIYCAGRDTEPFLVAPKDSGVMEWEAAMKFAVRKDSELPTKEQLDAMYEARNAGALKDTFNRSGLLPATWYWSSEHSGPRRAWCQFFRGGGQTDYGRAHEASVRCVRKLTL